MIWDLIGLLYSLADIFLLLFFFSIPVVVFYYEWKNNAASVSDSHNIPTEEQYDSQD